jgi:hypothetical protein
LSYLSEAFEEDEPVDRSPGDRRSRGWWAVRALGLVGTAGLVPVAAFAVSSASAAPAPTPSYHPGSDTATFAVTGVLDSNCLVSTGGTEIWIKPGDVINFESSLVGINVAGLPLHVGQLAGLNVSATIDAGTTSAQTVTVAGAATTSFPPSPGHALAAGDHSVTWTATGVPLVGGLVVLPLSSAALQSGASLTWNGVIHVSADAAQCKIGVGTPQVGISVGPVKVTVPPIDVSVPTTIPTIPIVGGLLPGASSSAAAPGLSGPGIDYTDPGQQVPDGVVPRSGGQLSQGAGAGVNGRNAAVDATGGRDPARAAAVRAPAATTVALSARGAPGPQYPVVLAIAAIVALAVVSATFARRRLV